MDFPQLVQQLVYDPTVATTSISAPHVTGSAKVTVRRRGSLALESYTGATLEEALQQALDHGTGLSTGTGG